MGIRKKEFDIQEYMTKGVKRIVSDALKATLKDPCESAGTVSVLSVFGR